MSLLVPIGELPFSDPSASGVLIAVILIGAGYLNGRLIHSISGSSSRLIDSIMPVAKYPPDDYSMRNRVWYEIRKSLPIEDDEKIIDDFFAEGWAPERVSGPTLRVRYPYVDFEVIQGIKNRFKQRYDFDPENTEERTVRHFAYSELYDSQSLYERYNILATFFRNIAFTFWASSIISIIQYILFVFEIPSGGISIPWLQENNSWILLISLFAVSIISSRQLFEFSFRRNRHLVIDFYNTITDSESE